MGECPFVPPELVRWLEANFPDRSPSVTDTDRQIWTKVGNVEVVKVLQARLAEQEESTVVSA